MWPFRKRSRKTRRSHPAAVPAVLRARYDAAQTTADNARHWAMADALSPDSAASADVRKKLREPHPREQLALVVLDLRHDPAGPVPTAGLVEEIVIPHDRPVRRTAHFPEETPRPPAEPPAGPRGSRKI